MLNGIHFLLTYTCIFECDHCFLYSGPGAKGTFTLKQVNRVLDEAENIGSVESIFFEGGEPFLYYPLLLESIKTASSKGFSTGIVTNGYWAETVEDAVLWLKPFRDIGLSYLSISDDPFHYGEKKNNPAKNAITAAETLNIESNSICIDEPTVSAQNNTTDSKGEPVIGGGARFRGRAVEKLISGLPQKDWESFTSCPYEELKNPKRVHIDSFGNVHLCQGLIIGNFMKTSLTDIISSFNPDQHPVVRAIVNDGPAGVVKRFGLEHEKGYVDECHICYQARLALISRFPEYLGPRQVYGLRDDCLDSTI